MPNCLQCGTWNPDDKLVCWRCQAELPKPQVKRQRTPKRILGIPLWLFLAMIFFLVMFLASRCFVSSMSMVGG